MPGRSDNSAFEAWLMSTARLFERPSLRPSATAFESRLIAAVSSAVFWRIWSGVAFGEQAIQLLRITTLRTKLRERMSMAIGCGTGDQGWVPTFEIVD